MRTWVQSLTLVLKVTYHYINCNNIIPILRRQRQRKAECFLASPNQSDPGLFLKTQNGLLLKKGSLFALADTYMHSHMHIHLCIYTFLHTLNYITNTHTYKRLCQKMQPTFLVLLWCFCLFLPADSFFLAFCLQKLHY